MHEQFADDLALLALGELTGADRQRVKDHLQTCAACRRELQALRSDLGIFGLTSSGPQSPARSKERLLRAIAAEPRGLPSSHSSPPHRRNLSWAWIPLLAGIVLLCTTGIFWRSNRWLRRQLAEQSSRNQDQTAQLDRANQELMLLTTPDAVHVSLSPQKAPRQPSGTAIFSPSRRRMMFMASNLAPLPPGKAYELWIIPATGSPIPAGVFEPDNRGNAILMDRPLPQGAEASAFAVTIEKEEGSDKPTSPILLMGSRS